MFLCSNLLSYASVNVNLRRGGENSDKVLIDHPGDSDMVFVLTLKDMHALGWGFLTETQQQDGGNADSNLFLCQKCPTHPSPQDALTGALQEK